MRKEDILTNIILTLFIGVSATLIINNFKIDINLTIIITSIVVSLLWLGSFIKEINQRSINNSLKIQGIEKDLNIERRLSNLESWKENFNAKKKQK